MTIITRIFRQQLLSPKLLFHISIIAFVISVLGWQSLQAQVCTITPTCAPGNASNPLAVPFGTGIGNVTLGGTLTLNAGGAGAGYLNLKCTQSLTTLAGSPISISVATSVNVNENLRVWVDWNNDEVLDPFTELAYSSNNAKIHNGFLVPPASAVTEAILRIRIQSDNISSPIPGVCTTPEYGQAIDIGVRLIANLNKPVAKFASPDSITCSGQVQFYDLSINAPSTWVWSFGDGGFSTVQNPIYQYTGAGVYTVQLITSNNNGADTLTKINYVLYRDSLPVAAVCTPTVTSPCCNYGVSRVRIAGINTAVGDSSNSNGYRNLTCLQQTELYPGTRYSVSFATNPTLFQDSRLYIDLNGDGDFFDAGEEVWNQINTRNPRGSFVTPSNVILDRFVRMRLISDYTGSSFNTCNGVINGAVQDYTAVFRRNTNAPVASFVVNQSGFCSPNVSFSSTSTNSVDSLFWDFGDGLSAITTSSAVAVQHTYTALGSYTVRLIAKGQFGIDTIVTPNAAVYSGSPIAACPQQNAQRPCCGFGIYRFKIGTLDKTSGPSTEGYKDFTCQSGVRLIAGGRYDVTVQLSPTNQEQVGAWLDRNNDGIFQASEQLFLFTGVGTITRSVVIPSSVTTNIPLRLRLVSDAVQQGLSVTPCTRSSFGQAEDYTVLVESNQMAPIAQFGTAFRQTCRRTINFADSSFNVPSTWRWDFGNGDTSNIQNPTVIYASAGTYTVSLTVTNQQGTSSVTKTNYLTILSTEVKPARCIPVTANPCCNFSLDQITIGNAFRYRTGIYNSIGYTNLACDVTFSLDRGKQYPTMVSSLATRDNTAIYIDFNNNGDFETTELVFSGIGSKVHTGNILVSPTAVTDTILRMRVINEAPFTNSVLAPCGRLNNGQTWDFGVIINKATISPIASFKADRTSNCNGGVQFSDTSTVIADTWLWSFGDGETSTDPFPFHRYATTGTYTVKLIVNNQFGSDTLEKLNYIDITGTWAPRPANCAPVTSSGSANFGITNVTLGNINRTTGFGQEGYQDFTCTDSTTVVGSQLYVISITVGTAVAHQVRVYLDINDNGILEDVESVLANAFTGRQQLNFIVNPGFNGQVWNKYVRMRVMATPVGQATNSCNPIIQGQAEDYSVYVSRMVSLDQSVLANSLTIYPNPTTGHLSVTSGAINQGMVNLTVTNAVGQQVRAYQTDATNGLAQDLDLADLPKGIYYLKTHQANAVVTKRIVLQ